MEKEIQIHVVGATATGKTTIAELLQELLTKEGFNSTRVSFGKNSPSFGDNKERRLETAKAMVHITITEVQAVPYVGCHS